MRRLSRAAVFLTALLQFLVLFSAPASAEDAEETSPSDFILVLDGSGSMWGQIEGEAKITIAKSVLEDLLAEMPTAQRLGLMAYGHRRKGDCSDIEELATVGTARETISKAVQGISPKGKTPMADAVKMAAEKLQYTERKATVILVSDGIETCAPDPCAVAAALEKSGVDFTAHVIGFGIVEENDVAQLRCIAENTGGTYVSAANAGELGAGLEAAVAVEEAPVTTTKLRLRATELEGGLVIESGLTWRVEATAGDAEAKTESNAGSLDMDVAPGTYTVTVTRPSDGLTGKQDAVEIRENTAKTVTIALTFPVEASLQTEPAGEGMAGTDIKVQWSGPDRKGDFISIGKKDEDARSYQTYRYVSQGNPATLRLPVEPGDYVIRYMLGRPIRDLAETSITVTPATATLTAQDEAIAGEEVLVEFDGPPPGSGDWLTVVAPDAADKTFKDYYYSRQGSPARLRMPLEPGTYELRFVQGGSSVLARRPITVVTALATVTGPETAIAGEEIEVQFSGPAPASGDWITVSHPDAPPNKYTDYYYTRQNSPGHLRMPLEPGDYELRFIQGGKKIIARKAITIVEATASLSAPESAIAGETVSVDFTGPAPGSGDWITVAAPDKAANAYTSYHYTKQGSPAKLRMPLEAGTYEFRVIQSGKKILARKTIEVLAATATLTGPASAIAGETIEIAFEGPMPGSGDYIVIARADQGDTDYVAYGYVSSGSPTRIKAPKDAGPYEIRYMQGGKKILARAPLDVVAQD